MKLIKQIVFVPPAFAKDAPNALGHPYTCDGQQVPDLPALCSPQQILVVHEDGTLKQLTDWIDVPALLAQGGTLGPCSSEPTETPTPTESPTPTQSPTPTA